MGTNQKLTAKQKAERIKAAQEREAREKARSAAAEAQARLERDALAAREQLGAEAKAIAAEIANYALGRKVA